MNWRSRSSLARRSENACSSRSSMRFSATPTRPTSVRSSVASTRWERSPPAIRPAVWPMRSSGSRLLRTTTQATAASTSRMPTITSPSTSTSRLSVSYASVERDGDDRDLAAARARMATMR